MAEAIKESSFARKLLRNPWFWGAVAGVALVHGIRPFLRRVPPPPPVTGQLPAFELHDQDGRPVTRDSFLGHVTVMGFASPACPAVCREVFQAQKTLQETFSRAKVNVQLVTVIFEGSPFDGEIQKQFVSNGADPGGWRWLAGSTESIRRLADAIFKGVGVVSESGDLHALAHHVGLVLVDGKGALRGAYGLSPDKLDEIFHRALVVPRN